VESCSVTGKACIDMDFPSEDLDRYPPGPPSRQMIHIPDEDSSVRFTGYETVPWRQHLWRTGCVLTMGLLGLLGHWFPHLWLRWVTREKAFIDLDSGFIVVEVGVAFRSSSVRGSNNVCKTPHRAITLFPIRILRYPYHISTVFPAHVVDHIPLSVLSPPKLNGGPIGDNELLDRLHYFCR
jgi:cation-transporting ATPase 13A2